MAGEGGRRGGIKAAISNLYLTLAQSELCSVSCNLAPAPHPQFRAGCSFTPSILSGSPSPHIGLQKQWGHLR